MGSASFHFVKFLRSSIIKNNPNVFLITKKFELFQIGCKMSKPIEPPVFKKSYYYVIWG